MTPDQLAWILEPKLPPKDRPVVITTGPLLGLGDLAVYSTLPERFTALGYDVYYDADNNASNDEIGELFWNRNPYVKGPSNLKPNAGYVHQGLIYEIANRLPGARGIEAVERAHGLPPPYSMAPKVYYEPKPPPIDVSDTVLVDFSAVSSKVARERIGEHLRMAAGRFKNPAFLQLIHPPWVVLNQERYLDAAYLVPSIYDYLDLLHACRAWIGSEAGGQSLAAAVRGEHDAYEDGVRPEIMVCTTRQTYNSRLYAYRNADYHVTCDDGREDFWTPTEVAVHKYENSCKIRFVEMNNRRLRG